MVVRQFLMFKRCPAVLALPPVPYIKILTRELHNRGPPPDEAFQSNYGWKTQGGTDSPDDPIVFFDNLYLFEHHHGDGLLPGNNLQWLKGRIEK
jgi:hypothetical protein